MAIDDSLDRARLHPDVLKNLNKNKKLKVAEAYSEDNPPPYPVTSVNGQTGDVDIPTVDLPVPVQDGGTGANSAATARSNLQAAHLITPANLAGYGLSVSGTAYNFTLAQLFQAVPTYSRVVIPWIQSQNTTRFGTLAAELPTNTTDYGMLTLEKSASIGEFRFIRYSTSITFHGSFTTVNSRGFNGWIEGKS